MAIPCRSLAMAMSLTIVLGRRSIPTTAPAFSLRSTPALPPSFPPFLARSYARRPPPPPPPPPSSDDSDESPDYSSADEDGDFVEPLDLDDDDMPIPVLDDEDE